MAKSLKVGLFSFKLLLEFRTLCLELGIVIFCGFGYLGKIISLLFALVILLEDLTEFCVRSKPLFNRLINVDVGGVMSGQRLWSQEDEVVNRI